MELRVLRYFLEMARENNMSRAAQNLHITQPTMSKQIRELEDELGVKLYNRTNYNIELTEAGFLLQKRAQDIIDLVNKTELEFKDFSSLYEGTIYVGSAESHSFSFVAKTIHNLQKISPKIQVHLYSGNVEDVLEKLEKNLLDFALIMDYQESTKYDSIFIPSTDTWGLLVPKDDPLTARKSLRLEDLIDLPLICSRQNMIIDFPSWFGPKAEELNIVGTYNLLFNVIIMVQEKVGYALTFDKIANTTISSNLTFIPIENVAPSYMYCLWRKNTPLSSAANVFKQELLQLLESYRG
ncbi:LysR family transcriptional regulator [uncultured Veillonella sp.]|uniref:LysR family transcriptional regulator n=1 Tax=uncultured Veillonella sp. TaxID=159268 RepID=UPI002638067A|nr:LysR family transcriptional regulator [uncultured Veillonella sp.]